MVQKFVILVLGISFLESDLCMLRTNYFTMSHEGDDCIGFEVYTGSYVLLLIF